MSKVLFLKASLYMGAAKSKVCLLQDSLLISLINFGGSRSMIGGWFDERLMYSGSLFGFLYGL